MSAIFTEECTKCPNLILFLMFLCFRVWTGKSKTAAKNEFFGHISTIHIAGALDIWKAKKALQGETGGLRMVAKFDFYLISNFNCWVPVLWKVRYPAGSHSVRCFGFSCFVFILRQNNLFWHLQQCSLYMALKPHELPIGSARPLVPAMDMWLDWLPAQWLVNAVKVCLQRKANYTPGPLLKFVWKVLRKWLSF